MSATSQNALADELRAMKREGEPVSRIMFVGYRRGGLSRNQVREIIFGAAR